MKSGGDLLKPDAMLSVAKKTSYVFSEVLRKGLEAGIKKMRLHKTSCYVVNVDD